MGLALVAMCLASSCDDSTTDPTINAEFNVAVEPDPVSAVESTNDEFQWLVSFTATFTETNGVGAAIESVEAEVIETEAGIAIDSDEEVLSQLQVDTENNRIEGNSSRALPISVFYTLPGGGTEANINLEISIVDDLGAEVGGTLQVRVE
jgi:hypothetical protein